MVEFKCKSLLTCEVMVEMVVSVMVAVGEGLGSSYGGGENGRRPLRDMRFTSPINQMRTNIYGFLSLP